MLCRLWVCYNDFSQICEFDRTLAGGSSMHIPTKESREIHILTFEEAQAHKSDGLEYDKSKWIYIPDFYSEYRYVLGTIGKKTLITIGINPSTAAPNALDNTLKSVDRIAQANGFDSFVMFNVYAQRATKPDDMDKQFNQQLHNENMNAFRWVLEQAGSEPTIWAAWGTTVEKRAYLKDCLAHMIQIGNEYHAKWCRTGNLSKHGHPHHPLYLRKDSVLCNFDIENYLLNL